MNMLTAESISISVRAANPEIEVIEICGEMNASAGAKLMEAYDQVQSSELRTVLLDFSRMDFMNSSGIGVLINLLARANRRGQILAACGLSPHFEHIFKLTRLNEAIPLYSTLSEALADLHNV